MRVMIIGASGTLGRAVEKRLSSTHEIIRVGRHQGDFQVDLCDNNSIRMLFSRCGAVDAIIATTGSVSFGPFSGMTEANFREGLNDKLMGQVQLVMTGAAYLNRGGSFTLTSGILAQHTIPHGVNATTVNAALEGFVLAVAGELPPGIRINIVSPTLLIESEDSYGAYFGDVNRVPASQAAAAYQFSIEGDETGKIYRVW